MMTISNETSISDLGELCKSRLQTLFTDYLQDIPSLELKLAMKHSLLDGGKRLRPMLIYATGQIFNAPIENLDIPAAAVEMIHTYSLIHDDLPCMDNADLRRGKPTCHKTFGEATAVLAGDALNTLGMQIIADHPAPLSPARRIQMLQTLSKACGPYGMAAGQSLDINLLGTDNLDIDTLNTINRLKTGLLLKACIELGRLASNDDDDSTQKSLAEFGECIGLAFQIQDDILDEDSSTSELGKPQGIDYKNNKNTYPKLIGKAKSRQTAENLYQQALEAINHFGHRARLLRELTSSMLIRSK